MSDKLSRAKQIVEQYAAFKDRSPKEQELYDFARFYLAYGRLVGAQADILNLVADGYDPESVDYTEVDAASEVLRGLINE